MLYRSGLEGRHEIGPDGLGRHGLVEFLELKTVSNWNLADVCVWLVSSYVLQIEKWQLWFGCLPDTPFLD